MITGNRSPHYANRNTYLAVIFISDWPGNRLPLAALSKYPGQTTGIAPRSRRPVAIDRFAEIFTGFSSDPDAGSGRGGVVSFYRAGIDYENSFRETAACRRAIARERGLGCI